MTMVKGSILAALPPFKNESILIENDQDVKDIVDEVLQAHSYFAEDYDQIAQYFWTGDTYTTCEDLFKFCKAHIKYKIETEGQQTTRSPAATLEMGCGDCKHYAGFIAGVLDAINRVCGENIKWKYCFASYDMFNELPQHVYVIAKDSEGDIWIDPVLKKFDERMEPTYSVTKKAVGMLNRISGIESDLYGYAYKPNTIGWTVETSTGYTKSGPAIVPKIGDSFYGNDYLGLSRYGVPSNTDLSLLLSQLQTLINSGPMPYTLSSGMLDKVLRDNVQNWNFFYPNGTSPVARDWENDFGHYLKIILTPDERLTFDRDAEPPHNLPEIHHIVDNVNYYVQQFGQTPYVVLIDHLKRLGKGWKTPGEGSLWDLIHTGDVHYKAISEAMNKIPGLQAFLGTFGLSLDSLQEYAKKFLGPKSSGGGGGNMPPATQTQTKSNLMPLLLVGGAALLLMHKKRRVSGTKNQMPLIILGASVVALSLFKKKEQTDLEIDMPVIDPGIPVTATPTYQLDTGASDPFGSQDYDTTEVKVKSTHEIYPELTFDNIENF